MAVRFSRAAEVIEGRHFMQIDIKTSSVTQLRQTFSHVARRLGGDKPASRYQEATFDLQSEANFHYRPLWEPELELYDRRRTKIQMKDWYSFKDPRQYYYASYTIARSRQQDAIEKNIEFVEKRGLLQGLSRDVHEELTQVVIPLRHLEWGANTNNCYITAYGYGTAITQAAMFQTMDRLGIAQYLSRIGLLLDGNSGDSLSEAKTLWVGHDMWQPLRRHIENLMVTRDWFELLVAQNLVLDGLLYPLVYQKYDRQFSAKHGTALSLITEFMANWFGETSRWVDATVKVAATESPANAVLLREWVRAWSESTRVALAPFATRMFGADAPQIIDELSAALEARVSKLSLDG